MALDAEPDASGIQTHRSMPVGALFEVTLEVTAAAEPYQGYEWSFEYSEQLQLVEIIELPDVTGLDLCVEPSLMHITVHPEHTRYYGGCLNTVGPLSYLGMTTLIDLRCVEEGSFSVYLIDAASPNGVDLVTSLLLPSGVRLPTSTSGITIECT